MELDEKRLNRRTILFSIVGGVILTASIIFFVIGLLALNNAKKNSKVIYVYVDEPFDPKGEQAEENAKVDLVHAQMMFENQDQLVSHVNLTQDIEEESYLGKDIYAYEYQYVNSYGKQYYTEVLWAENSDYVRRFTGSAFAGYAYNVEGKAYEYVQSKQYRLDLNAYVLDFESNSGANSVFTTTDASINEMYAHYTHTEYDPDNLQMFRVNLFTALQQVMIMPDVDNPAEVDFLMVQPKHPGSYDDMPGEWLFNNYRDRERPNYNDYADIDYNLLPDGADYKKIYVQPKNGAYGSVSYYTITEDDRNEFYIGFIDSGDKTTEYGQMLLDSGWTLNDGVYEYPTSSWVDGVQVQYKKTIKLSYQTAEERPAFEKGVFLVDHSRTIVE